MSYLSLIETRSWLFYPWSSLICCTWEWQVERGFPRGSFCGASQAHAVSSHLAPSLPALPKPGRDTVPGPWLDTQLICLSLLLWDSGWIRPGGWLLCRKSQPSPSRHRCGTPGAFPWRHLSHTASSSVLRTGLSPGSIPDGKALIFKTPETICAYPLSA